LLEVSPVPAICLYDSTASCCAFIKYGPTIDQARLIHFLGLDPVRAAFDSFLKQVWITVGLPVYSYKR
jgi:hypothetical protein